MAKPWGKYELDFIDHPKFQRLTTNAIALWWQIKNYCDKFHTDGLLPLTVVRGFRFYARRSMELLTTSCGVKPNGDAYAPLCEPFDIGGVAYIRMHDYLDHNDCREVVLKRLEQADKRREDDAKRKAEARAKKLALSAHSSAPSPHESPRGHPHAVRKMSASTEEAEAAVEAEEVLTS